MREDPLIYAASISWHSNNKHIFRKTKGRNELREKDSTNKMEETYIFWLIAPLVSAEAHTMGQLQRTIKGHILSKSGCVSQQR